MIMMRVLAITNKGIEKVTAQEVQELTTEKPTVHAGAVSFTVKTKEELVSYAYRAQAPRRIMILLDDFDLSDMAGAIEKIDLSMYLSEESTFMVECDKTDPEQSSQEISASISDLIKKQINATVKFKQQDITFIAYVREDHVWFGVDIVGFDLSKRAYRVFLGTHSIKGNVAYGLVRMAQYSSEKKLIDPFCRYGIIPIEAALFSKKFSVNHFIKDKFAFRRLTFFEDVDVDTLFKKIDGAVKDEPHDIFALDDQFKFVQATRKNAQIAGVLKDIKLRRKELEWLDLAMGEKSIDCIVTFPPIFSKQQESKQRKLYKEFFHQAAFVCKPDAHIVLCVGLWEELVKEESKQYGFDVVEEIELWQGKERFTAISLKVK